MSPPVAPPLKILCYAPYLTWQIHAAWEATMLLALQADGAQVSYVLCDGMYPVCDLDTPSSPRTPLKCERCQAFQAGFLAQFPLHFQWLNRYLSNADREDVVAWTLALRELPLEALERAEFDGQPMHSWVRASLHLMFKVERLDLANEDLRWWYGDNDIDMKARRLGGTLILPGPVPSNRLANQSTTGILAEQAGKDRATFESIYGPVPW